MSDKKHQTEFSDSRFWRKLQKYASLIGCPLLCLALKLYFSLRDNSTPKWARTTIIGALAYLISPIDALPDLIPIAGYTDDLGVLMAAASVVAVYIKPEHSKKAREAIAKILPDCKC